MRFPGIVFGTLGRYVAKRFLSSALGVFFGIFFLVVLIDYIELTRRSSSIPNVSPWVVAMTSLYRVPQITERLLPFSVLVGAMVAYLNLSRRNELVVARAAGISAWQFVSPTVLAAIVLGIAAAAIYNPIAATLGEQAKRLEASIFGNESRQSPTGSWVRQRSGDQQAILHASASREQGRALTGVTVFVVDASDKFVQQIEAETAVLDKGFWQLSGVRLYDITSPPRDLPSYRLATNLTGAQVSESFATPETVSFWELPKYIDLAERAGLVAAGYRLQYQSLLARPFLLGAMVMLAASVSLRFFRFGGVQRMVLSGVGAGFLLYVLGKVTEDLSKAELMLPVIAAWLPVSIGVLTGVVTLLNQEDG